VPLPSRDAVDAHEQIRSRMGMQSDNEFVDVRPFEIRIHADERRVAAGPGADARDERTLELKRRIGAGRVPPIDVRRRRSGSPMASRSSGSR
jgi:hypothetical protein